MKVGVIDRFPNNFIESLTSRGLEVLDLREARAEAVYEALPTITILVMNSKIRLSPQVIDTAGQLKLVLRAGVGMDHIDQGYLADKGIQVHNTKGANADAVGEQTVGMLLAIRNHLIRANQQVKAFTWQREMNRGQELGSKTIGIVGYGHTGQAVARKLSGFGARLLAYDKYRLDYADDLVEAADIEQIMAEAEVISFHVPLTEETRHWATDAFFAKLAQPIYLLNLARGPIVEVAALNRALDEGKVIAAALDVLPNEKMHTLTEKERQEYAELFSRDNVMVSPHIGGWTVESRNNINGMILQYIDAFLLTAQQREA